MSVQDYALLMQQAAELHKQQKQEQEICRSRSKSPPQIFPNKIEEVMEPIQEQVCANKTSDEEEAENLPIKEEITQDAVLSATTEPSRGSNKSGGSLKDEEEQSLRQALAALKAQKEEEVDQLRRRLEETEQAMERICRQMGSVADRLSPVCVAQLLTSQLDKENEDPMEVLTEEKPEWDSVLAEVEESFRRSSASINQQEEEDQQQAVVYEAQEMRDEVNSYGPEEFQSWLKEHPHKAAQIEETKLIRRSSDLNNLEEEIEEWTQSPDPELEEMSFPLTTMETQILDRVEETRPESMEQEENRSDSNQAGRNDKNVVESFQDSGKTQRECPSDGMDENLPEYADLLDLTECNKEYELPTKLESNECISVMDLSHKKQHEEQVLEVQFIKNEILLEEKSAVNSSSQKENTHEQDNEEQPTEENAQTFIDESIKMDHEKEKILVEQSKNAFNHNDSSLIGSLEQIKEQSEKVESDVDMKMKSDSITFYTDSVILAQELTPNVGNEILERNQQRENVEERKLPTLQQQSSGFDYVEQRAQFTEDEESVDTCIEQYTDADWGSSDVEEAHHAENLAVIPVSSELNEESPIENQTESLSSNGDNWLDEDTQSIFQKEQIEAESSRIDIQHLGDARRTPSEERKMTVMGFDAAAAMEDNRMMPLELMPSISKLSAHHQHHHPCGRAELQLDQEHIPSVFLDTYIPPESHLVVSEAECSVSPVNELLLTGTEMETDNDEFEPSPVVLSGKMILSVIGMDPLPADEMIENVPRVSFPPEPYDKKIFLIPSIDPDELEEEEQVIETSNSRPEEEDEIMDDSGVSYRPPTPPIRHSRDEPDEEQANEFMTYDELEEVGEAEENLISFDGQRRLEEVVEEMVESILTESIAGSLKLLSPFIVANEESQLQRNREEEELEHSLAQITHNQDYQEEEEPVISDFTIREDFPEEEYPTELHQSRLMTEEEIQRAREEIEEIKKLLADVSSGRIHQFYPTEEDLQSGARSVITELANAAVVGSEMEGAKQTPTGSVSKGSSPDMDEYEVIPSQTAIGSSENKNTET